MIPRKCRDPIGRRFSRSGDSKSDSLCAESFDLIRSGLQRGFAFGSYYINNPGTGWRIHLVGPDGTTPSQADGPPASGDYPTSYWEPGEIIVDEHLLDTEGARDGTYQLVVGMYSLRTGDRLPAADAAEERLPNDAIPLAEVDLP